MAKSGQPDTEKLKPAAPNENAPAEDTLYDATTLALMRRVIEAAWTEAQKSFGASASDRTEVRVAMAERIIEAIEAGVVDEERLLRAALSYKHAEKD